MAGNDFEYAIGGLDILLPDGHMLPQYQMTCPDYDRFLPHLAKYLPDGSYVLDIGANCGDTVAAMAMSNPSLQYECYEADGDFYRYLTLNLERIRHVNPEFSCRSHNVMVGKATSGMALAGQGGTKAAVAAPDGQGIQARSLDELTIDLPMEQIALLKVDVDGYDYDVIQSAQSLLQVSRVPVFFECDYQTEEQYESYRRLFVQLQRWGLDHFALFDNFGSPMLVTSDLNAIFQLLAYVRRQKMRGKPCAIYYFDVLAFADEAHDQMMAALQAY